MSSRATLQNLRLELLAQLSNLTTEALTLYQSGSKERAEQVVSELRTLYLENGEMLEHFEREVFEWHWRADSPLCRHILHEYPFSNRGIWGLPRVLEELNATIAEECETDTGTVQRSPGSKGSLLLTIRGSSKRSGHEIVLELGSDQPRKITGPTLCSLFAYVITNRDRRFEWTELSDGLAGIWKHWMTLCSLNSEAWMPVADNVQSTHEQGSKRKDVSSLVRYGRKISTALGDQLSPWWHQTSKNVKWTGPEPKIVSTN